MTKTERAALEAWRAYFGSEPTEPLRSKGGALDPKAWCMETATALADGEEVAAITWQEQKAVDAAKEVLAA